MSDKNLTKNQKNQEKPAATETAQTVDYSSAEYQQYYNYDPNYYQEYYNYYYNQAATMAPSSSSQVSYAQQQQQLQQQEYEYDYAEYSNAYFPSTDTTAPTVPAKPSAAMTLKKEKSGKIPSSKVDLTKKIIDAPIRAVGGEMWQDPSLNEWDPNDFRLFCGNLGPEVYDNTLRETFKGYKSFQKARVVRDKKTNRSKGYGFVSFRGMDDYTKAFREINGKYVGNRPIKLSKSTWKDRNTTATEAKKIIKEGYLERVISNYSKNA